MNADLIEMHPLALARLASLGADVGHALAAARIPSNGRVDTETFFRFWTVLSESSPPDLGLRFAAETDIVGFDLASLVALHSSDLRSALERMARYKRLCSPKELIVEVSAVEVAFSTRWCHTVASPPARLVDASLAAFLALFRRGTGLALSPRRLELTRARADEAMLKLFFGAPVVFRAKRDALVLPRHMLDLPFATHHTGLLAALLPEIERQVAERAPTFIEKVREVMMGLMSGERPSLARVSRDLAVSPRTLQRRLLEGGTTYQDLLDDVRRRTARQLLSSGQLAVADVAFLLGFEELNSFSRAFRRWEGVSPNRWRTERASE
jgi:AraC-like DNA-binding protein